ncbi:hypothetical protein BH23GEM6_BH23GEM6_25950 [soil metagenome]
MRRAFDTDDGRMLPWSMRNMYLRTLADVSPHVLSELRELLPLFRIAQEELGGGWFKYDLLSDAAKLPPVEPMAAASEEWAHRWHMTAEWSMNVALRTLDRMSTYPEYSTWAYPSVGYWFQDPLVHDLLTVSRPAVITKLRAAGRTREQSRQLIESVAAAEHLVRARRPRNDGYDASPTRSLNWLARAVSGETAKQIANTTCASTYGDREHPQPTDKAVLVSNKATARLLGLTFSPRRGRPPSKR